MTVIYKLVCLSISLKTCIVIEFATSILFVANRRSDLQKYISTFFQSERAKLSILGMRELDWLEDAIPRLNHLDGTQRLDEELLCLLSWLSLNTYEERARDTVKHHFREVMQEKFPTVTYKFVGSSECGLYAIAGICVDA